MFNWRQKLHSFIQHPFVKDTAILQAGNFFNIGLGILTSVLTARLLQPDKYGVYTLISSFAGLIALFMNFGADRTATTLVAEAYAKKDKIEIKNVLTYFLKINGVIAPLIGIAAVIVAPFVTLYFYHSSYLGEMSRLAIITFIFVGTFWSLLTIALQVSRRMMNYVLLDNLNTLLRSALCIGLILLGWGVWGVLMGQLLAAVIMAIISLFFYRFLAHRSEYFPKIRSLVASLRQVSIKKYFN